MIEKVSEYLQSISLELKPCSIPLNDNQSLKRDIFLIIRKSSERVFQFLMKTFPIKFKQERPDKSLWFGLRDKETKKTIVEIEVKPNSKLTHYGLSLVYTDFDYTKYVVQVYTQYVTMDKSFIDEFGSPIEPFYLYMNEPFSELIEELELHFNQIPPLREEIRNKKLEQILNG